MVLLDHGDVAGIGSSKDMIDLYKQLLVHQGPDTVQKASLLDDGESADGGPHWLGLQDMNPNALEYGDRRAEMIGFMVLDENGLPTTTIEKGSTFTMKIRARYNEDIIDPIFAYTIKDTRGTEITGTNTMYERTAILPPKKGDVDVVSFTQKADLQGGEYLISFGLTGYDGCDFVVYHRLYDVCGLAVVSAKNTVGFYDMNSEITVERE